MLFGCWGPWLGVFQEWREGGSGAWWDGCGQKLNFSQYILKNMWQHMSTVECVLGANSRRRWYSGRKHCLDWCQPKPWTIEAGGKYLPTCPPASSVAMGSQFCRVGSRRVVEKRIAVVFTLETTLTPIDRRPPPASETNILRQITNSYPQLESATERKSAGLTHYRWELADYPLQKQNFSSLLAQWPVPRIVIICQILELIHTNTRCLHLNCGPHQKRKSFSLLGEISPQL